MDNKLNFIDPNTNDFALYAISEAFDEIKALNKKINKLNRRCNFILLVLAGSAYYLYSKNKKKEEKVEELVEE